ncbi:Protein of unknown function DUF2800 [uncultured Caudovirales phage]|uniref:DUF2800 domain-containing protein n=1 Tax=uncultured Caudovirales phage TaxID=2100421 RepID=A0A6J7WIT8_9CAUD|nr:Protein of unknown function DUF2800 [uncultured Caudovirales phage]
MQHSSVVGGSTAKRVINCPGSVKLAAQMPPQPSSKYADEGTLLHNAIATVLETDCDPMSLVGTKYNDITLTAELVEEKMLPALAALDEIDPAKTAELMIESHVDFGDFLPGAFGSTDVLMRVGDKAVVLDWKFGSGIPVSAEENPQLMFYAAAAMRSAKTQWVFRGAETIELVIVQPPHIRRWEVSRRRLEVFEIDLRNAVRQSEAPEAPVKHGDWCKFCPAKPICPVMNGAVERALKTQLDTVSPELVGAMLKNADLLEDWIKQLRQFALQRLENGANVPGYKLVAKRATRQWADEATAVAALTALGVDESELMVTELKSPAQVEKVLKKSKLALPDDLIVSVSSGHTLADEADARPPVVLIGAQLTAALSKIQ